MPKRKDMKQAAKRVLRSHYMILCMVCLFAALMGAEFSNSLQFITQYTGDFTYNSLSATLGTSQSSMNTAVDIALSGNIAEARKKSEETKKKEIQHSKAQSKDKKRHVLGRSRGVLAALVNNLSSGALLIRLIAGARSLGASTRLIQFIFVFLAILLHCAIWFFLVNMYKSLSRRIFLECRVYTYVPVRRFLFFLHIKKWFKVCLTCFMTSLFTILWDFTIIGGLIKRYSYFLVPYISAENPDISWRDAINLSKKMMKGHKWECFVADLSFLPWNILGIVTLGMTDVFFSNMYEAAFFSEYYANLRKQYKDALRDGCELMNDRYLFEVAPPDLLAEHYQDAIQLSQLPNLARDRSGVRGFLEKFLGITLYNHLESLRYEEDVERHLKIFTSMYALSGLTYPGRLFSIPESQRNSALSHMHYLRNYSPSSLIMLFFSFSFVGWCWEVTLHLVTDAQFVNRGVLHGPWLPIYGCGGVLMLTLLNYFRKKPLQEFFAMIVLSGVLEYSTSYVLEKVHGGKRWWDYSGYFLNLDGRICAEGLLVFALGGMAIVYLLAPVLDNLFLKMNQRATVSLCAALLLCFMADQTYSNKHPNEGKGITNYKQLAIQELPPLEAPVRIYQMSETKHINAAQV